MARFRGTIQGNRGEASRLGSRDSGLAADVNGWDLGVHVRACVNAKGDDAFQVYLTGGSNGRGSSVLLGTYTRADYDRMNQKVAEIVDLTHRPAFIEMTDPRVCPVCEDSACETKTERCGRGTR